jgi:hypothetical protein
VRKVYKIRNRWLEFGFNTSQFSLGLTVNRYHVTLDLVFFWIAVEF